MRLRLVAEAVGTALLVGIGTGTIVAGVRVGGLPQYELALAWFAAVAIPILLFARVSGAHLNPAVTAALTATGRFPAREAVPYAGAQLVGALGGSGAVLLALGNVSHLGATLPAGGDLVRTFLLELGGTLGLLASVLVVSRSGRRPTNWELLLPALAVGVGTYLIGPFTGCSLNPARSLAPALLSGDFSGIWAYFAAAAAAVVVCALGLRALRRG